MRHHALTAALAVLFAVNTGHDPCSTAYGAEYPLISRSMNWEPYQYDASTVSLYHLDEKAAPRDEPSMEEDEEDGLLPDIEGGGGRKATGSPGNTAANSNPGGNAARLVGDCEFVESGRFGGGLRFSGGNGILVGSGVGRVNSRTFEFWLRLDELPSEPATLVHFFIDPKNLAGRQDGPFPPANFRLQPDGSLLVQFQGESLPPTDYRCVAGKWVHLAVSWSVDWPHQETIYVLVNGKRVMRHKLKRHIGKECMLGAFALGNDPTGKSGFKGLVDEVRFSSVVRSFYENELDWPAPEQKFSSPNGQPFFRDSEDLVLHVDFNKTVEPRVATVEVRAPDLAVTDTEEDLDPARYRRMYPDGVEGRGYLLGDKTEPLEFVGRELLLTEQGTLSFWMRPLMWDNYTRDYRLDRIQPTYVNILSVFGDLAEGSFQRKFRKSGWLMGLNIRLHMEESVTDPVNLAPGKWTHLALTWEGNQFTDYVNGARRPNGGAWTVSMDLRAPDDDKWPYKQHEQFWLEAKPASIAFNRPRYEPKSPVPHTIIDDFRIYRRPLSPSEIANLAALYDTRRELKSLPDADMAMTYNGVKGEVKADLIPLIKNYPEAVSATVRVTKGGESDPVGVGSFKFDERKQGGTTVKTPPLEFASYRVVAQIEDGDGKVVGEVTDTFTRKPPPWWKSRAGISDKVMPEWTPMEAEGNVISVWGRKIHLAPSGLPEKVISAGEDILAGPVSLAVALAGKQIPLEPGAGMPEIVSAKEVRVDARGSLRASDFVVAAESYTEFDGMMWFDVTISPLDGKAPKLDSLAVRIPYRDRNSILVHWWSGNRNFRDPKNVHIGEIPRDEGVVFRSNDTEVLNPLPRLRGSFVPYVMLTGDHRGMAWFAENDRGWTQSTETPAVLIEREGDTVSLVLNVISSVIELTGPRSFAFGLHPTPVKPLEKYWRRRAPGYTNIMPDTFCGNNLKGRKGPTAFAIYPEDDWDAVNRRINGEGLTKGAAGLKGLWEQQLKRFEELGREPLPVELQVPGLYWDLQWSGPHPEHTREWAETWGLGHDDYQHYTPEFIDFASWAWNDWVTKTNKFVRGAYMDDCWGSDQHTYPGPVSYKLPDGHVQPGFQFRGWRERIKRMRQIMWDNGLVPYLTTHTTHTFYIPYHSFFDLICDGEDKYCAPPSQRDFIDSWSLARMRFMNTRKWGLMTTWLGFHGNSLDPDKHPAWYFRGTRAYTGFMAAHDILWGFDAKALKEFGFGELDNEFVPYWDLQGLAEHDHEHLTISAWKRPGKCLVILLNRGEDRLEARVKLNPEAMGLGKRDVNEVAIRDVDPTLLTYFKIDLTTMETPKEIAVSETGDVDLGALTEEEDEDDVTKENDPEKLPIEERKAKDPDGRSAWADGVLSCPVRRHDYRLFQFSIPEEKE